MNRRAMIRHSALAATAAPRVAPAIGRAETPAIRWRLTNSYPTSLDAIDSAGHVFARTVTELTEDRFQIRVFGLDKVVPALQALDAVQAGTVKAAHTASSFYIGKNPAFDFTTGVPFGLNTRQQSTWMYEGGGINLLNKLVRRYNA